MPVPPRTGDAVLELVRKSELADDDVLNAFLEKSGPIPPSAGDTASRLVKAGILTPFQARAILQGKHRGFRLGPYRILDQIGVGGMGQVYLAEHTRMRRRVALKVLPPRLAHEKLMVERFYREARAVAALDHPNIIRAHDVGCEKGTYFLVLEYIEGISLAERLAQAGGALPVGEACAYAAQAAAGLQHAHAKGLAHRDVKPGNLLVDREGVVKLLDMGLARFFENESDKLTQGADPLSVMGTADYVSPEQLVNARTADHRTDIYSLGATLYHLVTGRPPFDGPTSAKLIGHQLQTVKPAHAVRPEVPEELSAVIGKMMAKDPADRYQTAADVVAALLPFVGGSADAAGMSSGKIPPIAAAAISQTSANLASAVDQAARVRRTARRKKRLLAAGAGGALLAVVVVAVVALRGNPGAKNPDTPAPDRGNRPDLPHSFTLAFKLRVEPPHEKANVEAALFTPGDEFLITSGADKLIRVWDADGRPVRRMEGHTQNVRALSLMPDGRRLLSASHDGTLKMWDVATGKCLHTYEGHAAKVLGVAALADGRRFVSSAEDGAIWLWDAETEEVLTAYDRAPLPVLGLAVTRDGRRAVAGTWDSKRNNPKVAPAADRPPIRVWVIDIETGEKLREIPSDSSVSHVQISPDDRSAVFGTDSGVTLWDIDKGSFRAFSGVTRRVTCATFTPDGRYVLGTGFENAVTAWAVDRGKPFAAEGGMPGQGYYVTTSHDGKLAAVVGANGGANVWRLPAELVPPPHDPGR
jgi:serine/threonine-protein kinase